MHWVDWPASPNTKMRYSKVEISELNGEQLALCEAKLRLVEAKRQRDRDSIVLLKEELARDKKQIGCLIKVLKGMAVLCLVLFLVVLV